MIKPLIKLGIEENFLKLIKNIYKKLYGEKPAFLLWPEHG